KLSMEGRMTICNMSIEAGARAGLVSPDQKTIDFLEGREYAPKGELFEQAKQHWLDLATDEGAEYDHTVTLNASEVEPQVTWGTNPSQCIPVNGTIPNPDQATNDNDRNEINHALEYMGLEPDIPITSVPIEHVF